MVATSVRALPESLLQEALRTAISWAHTFCAASARTGKHYDPGDIEAAAAKGAFNAWDRYDPQRGTCKKWEHWLYAQIRFEVLKSLRPQRRQQQALGRLVSIHKGPYDSDDSYNSTDYDEEPRDPRDLFALVDLQDLVSRLEPVEQWILGQRYFGNMEHRDIAEALGETRAEIVRRERNALSRLRELCTL